MSSRIVTVTNQRMTVVFRMIAGLIARRIVCLEE
jgi:phosphatidylserine decarboxylase